MDTAEALAQLQSFEQLQEEALLSYQKSSLALSNFLWLAGNQPLYLKPTTIPDSAWVDLATQSPNVNSLDQWLNTMLAQHPKLIMFDFKIQSLKVERQLKFQSLLPKADLKYNFLQRGYEAWKGIGGAFMENNYKFGFNIAVPIPNRSGIGNFRSARIKIQSAELERDLVRLELENKLRYHYGEVFNLSRQVDIFSKAYRNYVLLLNAEKLKFGLGETTLFILNARENKALETQQKLLSLKAKYLQALTQLSWAGGQLN
jgi:outer membrane protein TolC